MAKDNKKGDDYLVYLNTGSQGSPTWVLIKSAVNPSIDEAAATIVVPEAGQNDGNLKGFGNPLISFTLHRDKGNTNVTAILTAARAGTLKEFAIADGPIATAGTEYARLESLISAYPLTANRGESASYAIGLNRHANSDYDLSYTTVPS